jgi:hypothetical protein
MDYSKKTKQELIALCKERGIKGYSTKKKEDILALLSTATIAEAEAEAARDHSPSENHYRVLSLFSGMGGMDIGFAEQVIVHKNSIVDPSMIKGSASAAYASASASASASTRFRGTTASSIYHCLSK